MMSPTSHVMRYTYEKRSSKYGDVEIPPLKYNYNLSTTFYGSSPSSHFPVNSHKKRSKGDRGITVTYGHTDRNTI